MPGFYWSQLGNKVFLLFCSPQIVFRPEVNRGMGSLSRGESTPLSDAGTTGMPRIENRLATEREDRRVPPSIPLDPSNVEHDGSIGPRAPEGCAEGIV